MSAAILSWAVLGISATGFFFLFSLYRDSMNKNILQELTEIKEALVGTMDKKGLISKVYDNNARIEAIEMRCRERHPQ